VCLLNAPGGRVLPSAGLVRSGCRRARLLQPHALKSVFVRPTRILSVIAKNQNPRVAPAMIRKPSFQAGISRTPNPPRLRSSGSPSLARASPLIISVGLSSGTSNASFALLFGFRNPIHSLPASAASDSIFNPPSSFGPRVAALARSNGTRAGSFTKSSRSFV